ncbi:hypothetical protein [Parvibaculum sp.]|uniref:hypothetical protein n=1 Tax=Parvibaculum sp. TaxID=2024848 RepID=UPI002B8BD933|nr:hypothetical protein [Parvibaculum sp.]HUD53417.1 hypothetical protein [Parvibaculum sp.]
MRHISKAKLLVATATAALLSGSVGAFAADKVSGDVGISYNSHFVSYGSDVWGGGNDFFGDQSTTFVYGDLVIKPTAASSIFLNVWTDNNDNTKSQIGGHLQEIDLNVGGTYTIGIVTLGAAYGSWNYAGGAEESVEGSIALDDSGFMPFTLSPKLTYHQRTGTNEGTTQGYGAVIIAGVSHSFALGSDGISLTFPINVAFFTDNFGADSGYAYTSAGASLGVPLSFISPDFGAWSINAGLTGYFTEHDALPGNPAENFLTGSIGLQVAF